MRSMDRLLRSVLIGGLLAAGNAIAGPMDFAQIVPQSSCYGTHGVPWCTVVGAPSGFGAAATTFDRSSGTFLMNLRSKFYSESEDFFAASVVGGFSLAASIASDGGVIFGRGALTGVIEEAGITSPSVLYEVELNHIDWEYIAEGCRLDGSCSSNYNFSYYFDVVSVHPSLSIPGTHLRLDFLGRLDAIPVDRSNPFSSSFRGLDPAQNGYIGVVSEPGAVLLLGFGLLVLALARGRRMRDGRANLIFT